MLAKNLRPFRDSRDEHGDHRREHVKIFAEFLANFETNLRLSCCDPCHLQIEDGMGCLSLPQNHYKLCRVLNPTFYRIGGGSWHAWLMGAVDFRAENRRARAGGQKLCKSLGANIGTVKA
ncbi:hypothetical protein [Ketogulonicigenium vulgare]|uniref:hypothetical protein n=1 Tax=Ketogulonicigenium vulgare TaxID=92945 RepID=UPI0011D14065|nr:hypothetical protein [Ketogulonicigenium vulgare]